MPSDPRFANFERIVFFTGAGMSAESGVPTYRGKGGIWKEYNYEEYACQRAFDRDPARVWEFHNYRRGIVSRCEPNEGHRIIARVLQASPGASVVTQNIDGLHQLAGATRVTELHGSLWRLRCTCGARDERRDSPLENVFCPTCGQYWRPDIVWFEDRLDEGNVQSAISAISSCDLLVSIGTSAVVYPAAELPLHARRRGALLVEINLEDTPMSGLYDIRLRGSASAMLAELADGG